MARLALTVAGAFIGNMILPGIGGAIGGALGTAAGNAMFPDHIQGPKLSDLHVQWSSYGAFIPQIWGTIRCGGTVVWATDLEPHENESDGKGSGTVVTTTTYTVSFDTIICRSRGTARLLRIWANGRVIYDARYGTVVTGEELPFVFYDGNSTQLADPTEEGIIGAGLVPAYRGVARVVFTDLGLAEFGNVIPQLNFEISTNVDEQPLSRSSTWTVITPTGQPLTDHRSVGYDADTGIITVAYWPTTGAIPNYTTNTAPTVWRTKTYDVDGTLLDTVEVDQTFANGNIFLCRNEPTLSFHRETGGGTSRWFKNGLPTGAGPVNGDIGDTFYGGMSEEFVYVDGNVYALGGNNVAWLIRYPAPAAVPAQLGDAKYQLHATVSASQFNLVASNDGFIYVSGDAKLRKFDTGLNLLQTWTAGVAPNLFPGGLGGLGVAQLRTGQWMVCADTCLVRLQNSDTTISFVLFEMTATLPWIEISRVESAVTAALSMMWNLSNGLALTDDGLLSVCRIDSSSVLHGDIVADVCDECGLVDYDVSELVDRELGIMTTQIMTGRAFIESLMPLRFYNAVDSDTAVKFVKRGKPSVVTIPDGDLAGRGESDEIPDKLELVRGNDDELPSTMFLKYFNAGADYQIGTQLWRRQSGRSKIVQEVNAAIVLTDADAKRIIDAWGAEIWNLRDKYKWSTLVKHMLYEPTDVQTVQSLELRVERQDERIAEGVLVWEGVRSRPGNFAQPGIGGEAEGFVPQEIPEPQETEALILDIPLIPDVNRQSVAYVAMQGALRRSWRGASLQKSIDGGLNYEQLLAQFSPDSIGTCETKMGNFGGPGIDEANIVTVRMGPGAAALVSVTRAAALAGANMCAIGAEGGGYEIGGFIDADLIDEDDDGSRTYDVSRFLRGRRGTENFRKGHAIGDKFVMLPTNTIMDTPRTDVGRTRHYKAVTIGRTLASADPIEFRSAAISLAALAPINLAAGFEGDGDCVMQWDRRSRISFGWIPGVPQPLGEEVERYRIRIYEDGTKQTVVRTDYSDTQEYVYLEADQITDFGGALAVPPAWDVAQKCLTGWGWASDGARPTLLIDDFPGYVPPNPAPTDTTYYVNSTMPFVSGSQVQALSLTPNQTWAIAVTVGAVATTLNDYVGLIAIEYNNGAPVPRIWAFSPIKGDFSPQARPYAYNLEGSPSASVVFQVIDDLNPNYPVVPSGATWYFNIRTLPTNYNSVPMICNISNVP